MTDRKMDQNRFPEESGAQKTTRPLNAEDLFAAIGEVDEELLDRAEEERERPAVDRRFAWRQRFGILAAAAACLLITFIGLSFVRQSGMHSASSPAAEAEYADEAVMEEAAEDTAVEAAAEAKEAEAPAEEPAATMASTETTGQAQAEAVAEAAPMEAAAGAEEAEEAAPVNQTARKEESAQTMDYAAEAQNPLILVSFSHKPSEKELLRLQEEYGLTLVYNYSSLSAAAFAPEEALSEEEYEELLESLREDALVNSAEPDQKAELH